MQLDMEIQNHKLRLAEIQHEVDMIRLARSIRPVQTATPFYRVFWQKLQGFLSQFKTKSAAKPETPVTHDALLRQEQTS